MCTQFIISLNEETGGGLPPPTPLLLDRLQSFEVFVLNDKSTEILNMVILTIKATQDVKETMRTRGKL